MRITKASLWAVLTMAEYIEREAALKEAESRIVWGESAMAVYETIQEAPAADVAPVRHWRWDRVKNPQWPAYSHDKCSLCGWWNTKNALCYEGGRKPGHSLNFCPNCGAKMDLEEQT